MAIGSYIQIIQTRASDISILKYLANLRFLISIVPPSSLTAKLTWMSSISFSLIYWLSTTSTEITNLSK